MTRGNVSVTPFREGRFSGVCLDVPPSFILEQTARFDAGEIRLCKQGSKLTAALTGSCFVKNYFYANFLSRFRHIFRRSRAESCFHCALAVREAGVGTPAPLGYFRERRGLFPVRDVLFTAALPPETLFMPELFRDDPERGVRLTAAAAAKLHARGIEHGDLSLRNIYLDPENETGVIDLDSCRLHEAPLRRKPRLREMARLISSASKIRPDMGTAKFRKLFLDAYRAECGFDLDCPALDARIDTLLSHRRRP
ncbi:MAG: phosphotransferase [Lentisphaeria bacterium]|nr:phosphotransferase [Lentisphaeria bacterium]